MRLQYVTSLLTLVGHRVILFLDLIVEDAFDVAVGLHTSKVECVGVLSDRLAELAKKAGCNYSPSAIFIGPANIRHIESKHTHDFDNYFCYLEDIISNPDYIGVQPDDGSLRLIKIIGDNVMLIVRITRPGSLFVRSLYCIREEKLQSYLRAGTIVPVSGNS